MSKWKVAALICISAMGSVVCGGVGFSQVSKSTVRLTSDPLLLKPFEAEAIAPQFPARLKLQAIDRDGKTLEKAQIRLTVFTPEKNPWLPTDFPLVEGTKLLEMTANAPKGELEIQQMLPIRGDYKLLVQVAPQSGSQFSPFQQTLNLSVAEDAAKYRNFAILVAILLAVGLGGGWVMGGEQKMEAGEIAPQPVRLLLSAAIVVAIASLLYLNISAELGESHEHTHTHTHSHEGAKPDQSGIVQDQGLQVQILGDRSATVGKTAAFQVKVTDAKTALPASDINLNLKTTQLENEWIAFAHQGILDATGQFTWQQQFFDGAPHRLEVEVAPNPQAKRQFQPFKISQEIDVEGIAPPLRVRLVSWAYLTGFVTLGFLLGFKGRQIWSLPKLVGERKA